jgi:hypothetical protein
MKKLLSLVLALAMLLPVVAAVAEGATDLPRNELKGLKELKG